MPAYRISKHPRTWPTMRSNASISTSAAVIERASGSDTVLPAHGGSSPGRTGRRQRSYDTDLYALRHTLHHQRGLNALAVYNKIDVGGWDGD